MNSNTTPKTGFTSARSMLRKAFILSIVCLFMPGCMNEIGSCGTPVTTAHPQCSALLIFVGASTIFTDNSWSPEDLIENLRGDISGKDEMQNNNGKISADAAKKMGAPAYPAKPTAPGDDIHIDLHDQQEKEMLHITYPALMRIAILLLFAVLII